jgi:anti-sigma regulatory factor (Ser/Thr protein kinase)
LTGPDSGSVRYTAHEARRSSGTCSVRLCASRGTTGTRCHAYRYAPATYRCRSWSAYGHTATLSGVKSESVQMDMPQSATPAPQFTQLLSATRRGARLARLLTVEQIAQWGWPRDSEHADAAALIVAELAANAVTHGRLGGRCFRLSLALLPAARLRIEVTDPRGERPPTVTHRADEGGRGLILVDALAADWGVRPYPPSGKTVWAEVSAARPTGR